MTKPQFLALSLLCLSMFAGCAGRGTPPGGSAQPVATASPLTAAPDASTVEQAVALVSAEGDRFTLRIVTSESKGVESDIYWDLTERNYRATTGPDEGIDTHGESCYPACLYVREQDVNALPIETWAEVLHHEWRHVEQARNNPQLARDFRGQDHMFTPYAAFMEACADYGINVEELYHAQERIDNLKAALGPSLSGTLNQACKGDHGAYQAIVSQYNSREGSSNAFTTLFPQYR